MAEKACVKRLQKEFRDLCKVLLTSRHFPVHPESWNPMWSVSSILNGLLSFMAEVLSKWEYSLNVKISLCSNVFRMDNSPTIGSVTTTVVEKQRLAKASLAFNCKNPTFKKVFPEYLDKYEEQLAAKQPKLEQDTSAPTQEGLLNPLLEKQGAKAELKKIEAPKGVK